MTWGSFSPPPAKAATTDDMSDTTQDLHRALLRAAKAAIAAWERWLNSHTPQP